MRRFLARCAALLRRSHAERELEREVASHLALIEEDFQRRGLPPEQAKLAARRAYGGVDLAKELHRDARSFVWLEQAAQDLRHAARNLSRSPGFAFLAILTLALGVGVNTTLFTAYDALALRPLPVADADRVVRLERWFEHRNFGNVQYLFSYPEYLYCRDHNRDFTALTAGSGILSVAARIDAEEVPEKLTGQLVSANYFQAMGVGAEQGRTFLPDEDRQPGGNPVMVISHGLWQQRFHADPAIFGHSIQINGVAFRIVGVASREFISTAVNEPFTQFWVPLSMQAQVAPGRHWLDDPANPQLQILGRLRPGAAAGGAAAEISVLIRQFGRTFQQPDRTASVTLQRTSLLGNTEDIRFKAVVAGVLMLVGLVLLVACANIANMLLARGATRQREIAIRLALGAGRGRMIRHMLAESLLLALAGGMTGVLLSAWSNRVLGVVFAELIAGTPAAGAGFTLDFGMDIRVFVYALTLSTAAGMFFGIAPALRYTRPDLTGALKEEGSSFGRRLTGSRLRSLLVGAQVAVSMLLLITAGLLMRGLLRSHDADPGFDAHRVILLAADFGAVRPREARARLMDRLKDIPELTSVAVGSYPMMGTWTPPVVVQPPAGGAPLRGRTLASYGSETYFASLGVPFVRGRTFTAQEARAGDPVAVISESAARTFWPSADPVGRRFQLDMDFNGTLKEFEVIGIVRDVRFGNLTRVDPAHVYLAPRPGELGGLLLHTAGDPHRAMDSIRNAVSAFDRNLLPGLWLTSVADGPMSREKAQARVFAMFASILASLALILAGVGIYGVMSYLVNQRVKEIGVRMALGASARGVLRSVVLHSLKPVACGMAAGIAGAAAASSLLHATLVLPGSTDVLYGVPFYDPGTFLGLALFVTAVAAIASAVPARRAVRVDPMIALRCE